MRTSYHRIEHIQRLTTEVRHERHFLAAWTTGETVKLSGFGTFFVRSKGERVGRTLKTAVEVPIEQRRVTVFKPSNVLKAHINGEDSDGED